MVEVLGRRSVTVVATLFQRGARLMGPLDLRIRANVESGVVVAVFPHDIRMFQLGQVSAKAKRSNHQIPKGEKKKKKRKKRSKYQDPQWEPGVASKLDETWTYSVLLLCPP